jgi:hypothetical protein
LDKFHTEILTKSLYEELLLTSSSPSDICRVKKWEMHHA